MAKVFDNILIQGLTGSLGDQLVFRRGRRGQTIVSRRPVFAPDREFTASQKAHQQAFREATAYARSVQRDEFYLTQAKEKGRSPYNLAVADWFNKPQVLELDVSGWDGQAGQPIRIKATDDVGVTQVSVVISDGNGTVFEQGIAYPLDGLWWSYVTTKPTNGSRRVHVTALDRPGNKAEAKSGEGF